MSDILPWHQGYKDGWDDAVEFNNSDEHWKAEEIRIKNTVLHENEELKKELAEIRSHANFALLNLENIGGSEKEAISALRKCFSNTK